MTSQLIADGVAMVIYLFKNVEETVDIINLQSVKLLTAPTGTRSITKQKKF